MRTLSVVLLALALATVAATGAVAETVCIPSQTQTQTVMPAQPMPSTGTEATVRPSVAAGLGAGPVVELAMIPRGNQFDAAYSRLQYQKHADVIALANIGAQRASDIRLKNFSTKVANERIKMNEKLVQWYPQFQTGETLSADLTQSEAIRNDMASVPDQNFDRAYAASLLLLMQQENRAANEGTFKTTFAGLSDQSNLVKRVTYNEITALQNWLDKGVLSK